MKPTPQPSEPHPTTIPNPKQATADRHHFDEPFFRSK